MAISTQKHMSSSPSFQLCSVFLGYQWIRLDQYVQSTYTRCFQKPVKTWGDFQHAASHSLSWVLQDSQSITQTVGSHYSSVKCAIKALTSLESLKPQ